MSGTRLVGLVWSLGQLSYLSIQYFIDVDPGTHSYMRRATIYQAFLDAHQRVRAVIVQIDQDAAYANFHPLAQTNRAASATWADR